MRRNCAWHECRNPFETAREDARFCSNNCRAKANKAKHRAESPAASPLRRMAEAPSAPEVKRELAGEDFGPYGDQGDYRPDDGGVMPKTPVGRIARLEDRLRDLEQDFDNAEPDRRAWEKLRPKVEGLVGGKTAAPSAVGTVNAEQVKKFVRAELDAALKSWGQRILAQDQAIASLRDDLDRFARSGSAMRAPPQTNGSGGVDKRVFAKITEFEAVLGGVRERLDAVEYDTGRLLMKVAFGPNAEDDDEDEQDDSWADEDDGDEDDDVA